VDGCRLACAVASAEMAHWRFDPFETCLLRFGPLGALSLRFGPLGALSLRFDPVGGVSFAVRSVEGVVFAVRSFRRRVFCGSVRWERFHSKDEIEHQAVLARNTERTVLMALK
jgi:hypothetical protein